MCPTHQIHACTENFYLNSIRFHVGVPTFFLLNVDYIGLESFLWQHFVSVGFHQLTYKKAQQHVYIQSLNQLDILMLAEENCNDGDYSQFVL